jgi:UDP-glucose 4-epimerase
VREVIEAVERVHGAPLPVREAERRAGDPPQLIAATEAIHQTMDWTPELDDLDEIVRTSLAWERKLAGR